VEIPIDLSGLAGEFSLYFGYQVDREVVYTRHPAQLTVEPQARRQNATVAVAVAPFFHAVVVYNTPRDRPRSHNGNPRSLTSHVSIRALGSGLLSQ